MNRQFSAGSNPAPRTISRFLRRNFSSHAAIAGGPGRNRACTVYFHAKAQRNSTDLPKPFTHFLFPFAGIGL
jgi:hypothetical protein